MDGAFEAVATYNERKKIQLNTVESDRLELSGWDSVRARTVPSHRHSAAA